MLQEYYDVMPIVHTRVVCHVAICTVTEIGGQTILTLYTVTDGIHNVSNTSFKGIMHMYWL